MLGGSLACGNVPPHTHHAGVESVLGYMKRSEPMLAMPLGLLRSTVFYASLYFTFVDCFVFGAPTEPLIEKA